MAKTAARLERLKQIIIEAKANRNPMKIKSLTLDGVALACETLTALHNVNVTLEKRIEELEAKAGK